MTTLLVTSVVPSSCDLLKIHYLCGRNDNATGGILLSDSVVICSKFITFVVEMTTGKDSSDNSSRCDLLKIHYLCGRNDNYPHLEQEKREVVICSKFITFVVEMTTRYVSAIIRVGL